jgi:hypothetical protein
LEWGPSQAKAARAHRLSRDEVDVRLALTDEPTNEEQRSKNMTAKQWTARAVMAAAMAAGLSACGGGGDSAAPAPTAAPEVLTAGLTIKNSSDAAFTPTAYPNMKVIDVGTNYDTATEYGRYAEYVESATNSIELLVKFSKTTGQVSRVTLVKAPFGQTWHAMGCGFDGFTCDNSSITINPTTNEIRVSSLNLKSLTFTSTDSILIMTDPNTQLAATPGTSTISGAVSLK